MPVNKVLSSDRSDFTCSEEPRNRHLRHLFMRDTDIVIRRAEHAGSPAIATEQECCGGWSTLRCGFKHKAQVLVCGLLVADVELDRLANGDVIRQRHRAGLLIGAGDVADEEIPAAK